VLESFRDTGGIERAMDYIFYQAAAVNGFDAVGHYLRAGLLVNQCTTYAVAPVAGCSAKFPAGASASSGQRETTAIEAAGGDPVLRATATALAQALGQEIEKARKQQAKANKPQATRERGGSERKPRTPAKRGGKPKRDEEIPEAIPTVDPAAPTPAPTAAPAAPTAAPADPAAPAAAAPPAAPTPAPAPTDPADALLDYLFGGDG
jgi:hypothetical protein